MFKAIKEFFFGKKAEQTPDAPYKVEAPAFKPTADAAPVETSSSAAEAVTISSEPVGVKPTPKPRKPRANVAAKKIAAAKTPAAKKPATPKAPKAPKAE